MKRTCSSWMNVGRHLSRRASHALQPRRLRKLRLEPLECRALLTAVFVTNGDDAGPGSLRDAIDGANGDPSIGAIIVQGVDTIQLDESLVYTGQQDLSIKGWGAAIEPSVGNEGAIDLFVSEGGADLRLSKLTFQNGAHGIRVPVPADAQGEVSLTLKDLVVQDNGLYGLLFDDQTDGSDASVRLEVLHSIFTNNGIAESDFDGVRVQEGGLGSIRAKIIGSQFDANGGDGLELDERGDGDIAADIVDSTFDNNGFQDPTDWDDGFDIDEAGAGNLRARIVDSTFNGNYDEGLDLDEESGGDVMVSLVRVQANHNQDEGIKVNEKFDDDDVNSDGNLIVSMVQVEAIGSEGEEGIALTEEGNGNLIAHLRNVVANRNGKEGIDLSESGAGSLAVNLSNVVANGNNDDGIQVVEAGPGNLWMRATKVTSKHNAKFGMKVVQEDHGKGLLRLRNVTLDDNGDGALETVGVHII